MHALATRSRLVPLLLAGLLLGVGCGPAAPEKTTVQPVALPNLAGLPEAAQQQLRLQHARTRGAAARTPDAALGREYGALGQLLFTYDFLETAEPAFRNAQALQPEEGRWSYYLGILYRQQGAFEEAAAQFEQVLDRDPEDTMARLRLADAYLQAGRVEAAKKQAEAVIADQPRQAFAHFLLGQIAYEAEDFEAAVTHYGTVLTLQPAATQVHAPLGMAYRNLGDEAQSQYHLDRRGQALVQLNDLRVRELEALKQSSGATALTQGQRLIDAGRYEEAIAALEQAAAQDSTNASTYLSLGVAHSYAGDQPQAVAAFERVLRLDPANSKARFNLGAIYAANGLPEQAEEQYRAAIASDPRHGRAQLELAERLRRTGRCEEAVEHFERALEVIPGDVAARQHLALCHLRLGHYAAARALLEDGLAANPDHLGFVDALARVLAASPDDAVRNGARALSLAEDALALRRRTETLETLAMAHAELERFEDAITYQTEAIEAAEQLGYAPYLDHLRHNLERYRQGAPCRTPWPDFMYEL